MEEPGVCEPSAFIVMKGVTYVKKLWLVYVLLIGIFVLYVLNYKQQGNAADPWRLPDCAAILRTNT